jgi:hypothetical protein
MGREMTAAFGKEDELLELDVAFAELLLLDVSAGNSPVLEKVELLWTRLLVKEFAPFEVMLLLAEELGTFEVTLLLVEELGTFEVTLLLIEELATLELALLLTEELATLELTLLLAEELKLLEPTLLLDELELLALLENIPVLESRVTFAAGGVLSALKLASISLAFNALE